MMAYQKNKKIIDDSPSKTCMKLDGKRPSGIKMELMEAINIAVEEGCITDRRISNIRCNLPTGSWEFYLEAEAPIISGQLSHCYVKSETREVIKVNFGPRPYGDEVPEKNTHPDNRVTNEIFTY